MESRLKWLLKFLINISNTGRYNIYGKRAYRRRIFQIGLYPNHCFLFFCIHNSPSEITKDGSIL